MLFLYEGIVIQTWTKNPPIYHGIPYLNGFIYIKEGIISRKYNKGLK